MTVSVRYYCPRCGTIATLERDAYLNDKSVTPYPLEGWEYARPGEDFEKADGVRLACGEHAESSETGAVSGGEEPSDVEAPCGEPFYLNFVRFEDGEAVETVTETDLSLYESPWEDTSDPEATVTITARKVFSATEEDGGDDDDNPFRVN